MMSKSKVRIMEKKLDCLVSLEIFLKAENSNTWN